MEDLLIEEALSRIRAEGALRHAALMQLQRVGVLRDTEMELIQLWAEKFHHGKLEAVHLDKDKVEMRELLSQVRDILRACIGAVRDVSKAVSPKTGQLLYIKVKDWDFLDKAALVLSEYIKLGMVTAEEIAAVVTFVQEHAEVGDREAEDRMFWVNARAAEEKREHKMVTAGFDPDNAEGAYPSPYPFRDITGVQISKWFDCRELKPHGLTAWLNKKAKFKHWKPVGLFAKVLYRLLRKLKQLQLKKGKLGDVRVQFFKPGAPVKFHIPLELVYKEAAELNGFIATAWELATQAIAGRATELDNAISKSTKSRSWFKLAIQLVHLRLGRATRTLPVDVFGTWPQIELRTAAGLRPVPLTAFLYKTTKPPATPTAITTPPHASSPPSGSNQTELPGIVFSKPPLVPIQS